MKRLPRGKHVREEVANAESSQTPSDPGPDALARNIVHSINNPLAALMVDLDLLVELLERDSEGDFRARLDQARQLLREARQAAERIRVVVLHLQMTTPGSEKGHVPADERVLSLSEPPRSAAGPGPRVRVLVVDDDVLVGRALRRCLQGCDVVVVDSGKGALDRIVNGERFDLIVSDLVMPGMTGMDLHEELMRIAPAQGERMVFATGGAVTTRARDFLATVPNRVMDKPFDLGELRKLVRSRAPH
jgi:CheY-like chemotaxis protein